MRTEGIRMRMEIGTGEGLLPVIFAATKSIRDKLVLSRLCWDLGILEEIL